MLINLCLNQIVESQKMKKTAKLTLKKLNLKKLLALTIFQIEKEPKSRKKFNQIWLEC